MTKPCYRKGDLANRYGVTPRSIDNMIEDGRLPPADFFLGRLPLWHAKTIEQAEVAAARRPGKPITDRSKGEAA